MAGFDFQVRKHKAGEDLQRALLRWIQVSARDLGLRFRYYSEDGEFWGVLDGPLPIMQVLRAFLADDFYAYAAAFPTPSHRRQREQIAHRLLHAFDEGLEGITEGLQEIADVWSEHGFRTTPNSLVFHYGSKSHLARPLRSLTSNLIQEMQGRISTATAVEELHTVLQLLLTSVLGEEARGLSFTQMVDAVQERGVIENAQAEDVKRLNALRRDAKHRGQGFSEDGAGRLLGEGTIAVHGLLVALRG